jgi:hypothetical protein
MDALEGAAAVADAGENARLRAAVRWPPIQRPRIGQNRHGATPRAGRPNAAPTPLSGCARAHIGRGTIAWHSGRDGRALPGRNAGAGRRRVVGPSLVVRGRLGAGAINIAYIPLAILRRVTAGGVGRIGRDRVEFRRLLFVDMLDRALRVASCEHAGSGEQSGDCAGLHRVPPYQCEPCLNARAAKCGRVAEAYAASRAA